MTFPGKQSFMTEEEFMLLRDLIEREFGILLKGDRRLTLHTKVSHRLRILGLATYRAYYDFIMSDPSREELHILASHITNNETYFFRERPQLEAFAEVLRTVKREKQERQDQRVQVLSLASSSGEEAYTLSFVMAETGLFLWSWDVRITGVDIDRSAISRARAAAYTDNSFRSLNGDRARINRFFTAEDGHFRVKPAYARNVTFIHGNILSADLYRELRPVDVIFCRNVLIYMSEGATERLIRNFYETLSDNGYLFIGSSESLIQRTNLFIPDYQGGVIVYRKNPEP